MLLLLDIYYDAMTKTETASLLSQIWVSRQKYITAIFKHLVLELCNNKNVRYWFKATLTLETRIGYICNIYGNHRGICDGLEMKLT